MRPTPLRALTLGALVVCAALVGLVAGSALAVDPPADLQYACAKKSNGLMRAATSPADCNPKTENVVTFSVASPVTLCAKPDGSVRRGACSGAGTTFTAPAATPAYFCADTSNGNVLRKVADPASCSGNETAFVVVDHPPTDIALSNSSVAENEPVGTTVGTLSATDPDAGDSHTFTLVSGTGDADNASFQITGSTLKTNAVFDYETKSSYSIRVRATDLLGLFYEEAFTITITDVVENAPPTDIQLSNSTVQENQPGGTNVGTLTTTDPDPGDTHTYSLVAGAGDEDNAKFQISGSTLQTAVPLDFEADSSLSVRIRTFDGSSGYEESFTITVTNANDPPSDIALSNSSVAENEPAGTNVGTLSATDQDAGATHTFSLVAGSGDDDNAKFQISGSTLQTAQSLDFEADSSLSVRVRADDGAGGTFEKALTITVTDVNEAPTDIALSNASVAENEPVGTAVGTLSATDPDAGDTHTFALVAGPGDTDNASFQIDGSTLETNAVFDFETKNSYSIRVGATDGGSLTFEEQFTITVTNVNEPPSDINLSNSSVAENEPPGTAVGTLTTVDDPGSTHTYTLVAGAGDEDNASFQIDGDVLETAAVFDFEADSTLSVRIRTDDGGGGTFEKQFTITVTDANDAPSDIALSSASVDENEPVGTAVGTLSATDQDLGQTHTFALVAGPGDTDNASFQIDGTTLKTNAVFNFEVKSSYSIRVRATDNGVPAASLDEAFTISIVDVNDPPVAVADSYGNAVGNTLAVLGTSGSGPHIVLTGNVITNNDSDEDTTFPHTVSAVAETVTSTGGGSATIAADGSFTFLPGVGDKNQVDTFTYHVTDGALQSAGTVSVTIANVLVWYVNGSGGAGDGRSSSPFNTLASLNGAGGAGDSDTTGDIIFLYSGTYGGGLPLEASQRLTGEPHGLVVDPGSGNVTLVPAGGTNPTIGNSGGAGIGLANGVEIQRVNVNGTSGAGVTGTSVTNATIGGNTSIGGATGNAFQLSGAASGTISVGSAISSATARSVSVQNRSGGSVNLTGNITDTGQGILLNSNTAATVNLTGSLTISTGTNAGFTATGGGTVNANTASNTIATTTGTALNVANTTIGASGLTFRSIASNGAVNGIVLTNTGATAGLTVAGNGAAGTGGTIQNSTGAGILLTSTRSPSFSWIVVQNGGDDGIRGSGVVNFTLANSTVFNNGNAVNESGLDFVGGLTGTASISSSSVNTYAENGVIVTDASGSLNLTVTGSSFINASAATGNDGIHLDANDTAAMTASVTGSTFDNNRGDHFQFSTNASSSGTNSVTYSGNTLTGDRGAPFGNDLGAGITISTTGSSDTAFTLASNNIQGAVFPTIGIDIGTSSTAGATLSGTVNNNTIGDAAVPASGGAQSAAIATVGQGAGTLTAAVTNNTIRQNDGFAAIDILSRDGSPTINATVTGNSIANPSTGGGNGLLLRNGAITTDGGFTCAAITGNSLAGSAVAGLDDFRLRQRFNTTVRLPGYGGAAGDTAAVVAFVQGNNPGAETGSATVDFPATGGGFVGGAACPTP